MEFTVGKMGRTYTTQIYKKLTGKKWLNIIGWNGNLAVFILFGFIVLLVVDYYIYRLCHSTNHGFKSSTLTNIQFETIISNPWLTVLGQGIFILITMVIVMLGVEKV